MGLGHQKQMYSLVPINLVGYLLKTDTNRTDTDRITSVYIRSLFTSAVSKRAIENLYIVCVYLLQNYETSLKEMSVSDKLSNVILSMR